MNNCHYISNNTTNCSSSPFYMGVGNKQFSNRVIAVVDDWIRKVLLQNGIVIVKGDKGDDGETPYIGPNGNWFIDGNDTGVASTVNLVDDNTTSYDTTWSSQKIKNALNTIEFGSYKIVDELPTEDISTSIIYLIDREVEENVKDAYVYSAGEWILVGNTHIDLSGYYTSQEVDDKIATSQQSLRAGTAIAIDSNKINLKYDTEFFTVNAQDKLTLKNKKYLKQIDNLNSYEGNDGEIIQYIGKDTEIYKNGHIYRFTGESIVIPANTSYFQLTEDFPHFPKGYYIKTTEGDSDYRGNYTNFYYHETNFLSGRTIKNEYGENVHVQLQNLNIGVGSIRSAVITTPLEPALFQIGDIAWDELNNLYRVTEITSNALYLKLYRQAYKGKVTLDGGRTFVELSEIIGQRVFPVYQGISYTRFQRDPEYYVNSRGDKVTLIAVETPGYKYGCFKRIGNSGIPEWSCDGFLNKINYADRYNLRDAEEIYYSGCTDIQIRTYEQVINTKKWEEVVFYDTNQQVTYDSENEMIIFN